MIIRGNVRGDAERAGKYLLDQGKNDRIELIEIRGTFASDIGRAVIEMKALAEGVRIKKFLLFSSINLAEGEYLTTEQWAYAWGIYEENQGLEGCQKIIVQHEKEGRVHQHALYNRINPGTMKVARMSNDYYKNEMTRSQLEKKFGFTPVKGRLFLAENEVPANRSPTYNQIIQGKRNGVNVRRWREESRQIMFESQGLNGMTLIAALESKGHMVALGKNGGIVLLDPSGTPHNMAKVLNLRVKNGELKARFEDVDFTILPTIEQAQEVQNWRLYSHKIVKQAEKEYDSLQMMIGMHDQGDMTHQLTDDLYLAIEKFNAMHQIQSANGTIEKGKKGTRRERKARGREQDWDWSRGRDR